MPVGTQATVKSLSSEDVKEIGYKLILVNTYHLYLQPGEEIIKKAGGVKNFMNWDELALSDSGGFQVLSLSEIRKIRDDGVEFKSFLDGSTHFFTPESTIKFQELLGVDIMMTLDICPSYGVDFHELKKFSLMSVDWAIRGKRVKNKERGDLFAVVQGGLDINLRKLCMDKLEEEGFPGYGIGGLSIGEPWEETRELLKEFVPYMPENKPRYFMGLGDPIRIMDAVEAGVDMFDCVFPTRIARNRTLLTKNGRMRITKSDYRDDFRPIEEDCNCFTCRNYTRAYLNHLFKAKELLAPRLATIHNLTFMYNFMKDLRRAIKEDRFYEFKKEFLAKFVNRS